MGANSKSMNSRPDVLVGWLPLASKVPPLTKPVEAVAKDNVKLRVVLVRLDRERRYQAGNLKSD